MTLDRRPLHHPSMPGAATLRLYGRRVMLRPLVPPDFSQWSEVRRRNHDWLTRWEPQRLRGAPDPAFDKEAFSARCSTRDRERQFGQSYSFGVFVDQLVAGEVNINNVMRGAMQSATIGYWIDEAKAGHGFTPEGVAVAMRFAFDELSLHRIEINIVPRNTASRRVAEKLELREEGVSERFVEIAGVWEDHVRYAITAEEWHTRRTELTAAWLQ
jgi:[ribosomal protein S5]-alanine N-acetyltransferase